MTPEQKARQEIDRQLDACSWIVQDYRSMNIAAGLGVAVREFPLQSGPADYLLYVDRKAAGVIVAKLTRHPRGTAIRSTWKPSTGSSTPMASKW
ncbi:MAG: hypothetical protein U0992_21635 [Planctomycetaceae bacterium]